jgi:NADPH-dependent 2,4-dienoyl-CoA reductase/sulfur reductase-like enzyme
MTGQPEHVLVIGAGLGGVRTSEQLRTAGYQGRISLVGAEAHVPYDRPPLSKQILTGEWEPGRAILRTLDQLDELGVRAHLGLAAVALRPGEVELSDGSTLYGDAVVVATGLVARRLPDQPEHVHVLRTVEDALALRATLDRVGSLLVVGAGFIGAEVTTAARARGIAVTVLEALAVPAAAALGPAVGALAARLFTEAGAELRVGTKLAGFVEADDRVAVRLEDGTVVEADAGVVGIGGTPRLDWIDGDRSPAHDPGRGLRCGPSGRVHGWERVWAVGDVASWDDPKDGTAHRHEHWTSAGDQAAVVARDILGAAPPPPAVPYFWSDQFGLKIQLLGRAERGDTVLPLHGEGFDGGPVRGTVAGYLSGDRLVAVVGFGAARLVARYRPLVADGATRTDVLARAADL